MRDALLALLARRDCLPASPLPPELEIEEYYPTYEAQMDEASAPILWPVPCSAG